MNSLVKSWIEMWVFPRKTISNIISTKPHYGFFILAFLTGSPSVFRGFFVERTTVNVNSMTGLIIALILSFIWGYIMFFFFGWFFFKTQKLFHKHETPSVFFRSAFAWSSIPSSAVCLLWIVIFFISELLHPVELSRDTIRWINLFTISMLIWTFILLVGSVSVVDRVSIGKAFTHTFVAVFFACLVMIIIGLTISLVIPFLLSTL